MSRGSVLVELVAALLIFGTGFAAGWAWKGDRCEVRVQSVAVENATARAEKTEQARGVEATQDQTSRRIDDDFQKAKTRLAAHPVPRHPGTLLGLRQPGTASASGVPALAQGAPVANAAGADALPDRGRCDRLERDAQVTTLMLDRLQMWARDEGLADD